MAHCALREGRFCFRACRRSAGTSLGPCRRCCRGPHFWHSSDWHACQPCSRHQQESVRAATAPADIRTAGNGESLQAVFALRELYSQCRSLLLSGGLSPTRLPISTTARTRTPECCKHGIGLLRNIWSYSAMIVLWLAGCTYIRTMSLYVNNIVDANSMIASFLKWIGKAQACYWWDTMEHTFHNVRKLV